MIVVEVDGLLVESVSLIPSVDSLPSGVSFYHRVSGADAVLCTFPEDKITQSALAQWFDAYGINQPTWFLAVPDDSTALADKVAGFTGLRKSPMTLFVTASASHATAMRSYGYDSVVFGAKVPEVFRALSRESTWDEVYNPEVHSRGDW